MTATFDRICTVLDRYFGVKDVTPETMLSDIGMDSLDKVELAMFVEDEFEIDITDQQATNALTLGELDEFVSGLVWGRA